MFTTPSDGLHTFYIRRNLCKPVASQIDSVESLVLDICRLHRWKDSGVGHE